MKLYELIKLLLKYAAGAEVIVAVFDPKHKTAEICDIVGISENGSAIQLEVEADCKGEDRP